MARYWRQTGQIRLTKSKNRRGHSPIAALNHGIGSFQEFKSPKNLGFGESNDSHQLPTRTTTLITPPRAKQTRTPHYTDPVRNLIRLKSQTAGTSDPAIMPDPRAPADISRAFFLFYGYSPLVRVPLIAGSHCHEPKSGGAHRKEISPFRRSNMQATNISAL
jgi:hypothetical protein